MKPFRMFTALFLVPRLAQDPVPGLCYQVRVLTQGTRGGSGHSTRGHIETMEQRTCTVTTCDSTYFTYFTYFYDTLLY